MKKIVLLIIILSLLTSCSAIQSAKDSIKDVLTVLQWITTDLDEAETDIALDSLHIQFNTVYWRELPDSLDVEYEKTYNKDGYRIWRIVTPNYRRYQVRKLDTTIYFYKKSTNKEVKK